MQGWSRRVDLTQPLNAQTTAHSDILSSVQPALLALADATVARLAAAFAAASGAPPPGGEPATPPPAAAAAAAALWWGEDDVRLAFRVSRKLVDLLRDIDLAFDKDANKLPQLKPAHAPAHAALQRGADGVFEAAVGAVRALQRALLAPAICSADPGVPLHSISGASKALALMWRSAAELGYTRVARFFESLKLSVGRRLTVLYADGAAAAAEMLGGRAFGGGSGARRGLLCLGPAAGRPGLVAARAGSGPWP